MASPSSKPPPSVGKITLDVYDPELWNLLAAEASERGIPVSLIVHRAVKTHAVKWERLVQWKREQDERDPELVEIHRFLGEQDSQPAR
jgi:hypothetical protein